MIPTTGPVTFAQVNAELGRAAGTAGSLNDPGTRLLACDAAALAAGSPINMQQLRGRSGFAMNGIIGSPSPFNNPSKVSAAQEGDAGNPTPLGYVDGIAVWKIGTHVDPALSISRTEVALYASPPHNRFWGMGVWTSAGQHLTVLKYSDANGFDTFSGPPATIRIFWPISLFDFRNHYGQTLRFVFVK